MFKLFSRATLAAAAMATVLSASLLTPLAAHAEPVRIQCKWDGNDYSCTRMCTQKLPDGSTVYYPDGTTITISTADGKETTFKCNNGNWTQTARVVPTDVLGTINLVGSIAGMKGTLDETICKPDSDCVLRTYTIGRLKLTDGGCSPDQITCIP